VKKLYSSFCLVFIFSTGYSQQDAVYDHYMFNQLVLNPAYAGSDGAMSLRLLHRSQWLGFEGAPTTQTLSIHAPYGIRKSSPEKMGLGLNVVNDKLGPNQNTGIYGSYAYRLPLATGKISMGLRIGLLRYGLDWTKIEYQSGAQLNQGNSNSIFMPDFDFGLRYFTENLFLGAAISHLTQPKLNFGITKNGYLYRHYMATAGYTFHLNQSVALMPSLLFRYVENSPLYLNINANLLLYDKFWLGVGYRLYGMIIMAGYNVSDKLKIGYSFDGSLGKVRNFVGSTHEILIGFDFNEKKLPVDTVLPVSTASAPKLHVLNRDRDTLMLAFSNEEGLFVFELLPDDPNYLFLLEGGDNSSLIDMDEVHIFINGEIKKLKRGNDNIFRYEELPFETVKLHLINTVGDTLNTATLNDEGYFVFEKLSAKTNSIFLLESKDAELIDEVQVLYKDEKGQEKVINVTQDTDKYFSYKYSPNEQIKLYLINKNEDTLKTAIMNDGGFFVFTKLPFESNYLFSLGGNDYDMIDDLLILLIDESGNEKVITVSQKETNVFQYDFLPELEGSNLGLMEEKEVPVILEYADREIINAAFENLEFNSGSDVIKLGSHTYLEKLSRLLIKKPDWNLKLSGHTDSIGSEISNLMLSKKRTESIKRFFVNQGVSPNKITVRYHGESQPVASNATPEGRQKNRRVEMLITRRKDEIIQETGIEQKTPGDILMTGPPAMQGISFRIQIFASKNPVFLAPDNFRGIENVEEYVEGGLYKYVVGLANDYDYARDVLLSQLHRKGYKDAFIVAFNGDKRIPVSKAIK